MRVIRSLLLIWTYFGPFTIGLLSAIVSPWFLLLLLTVPTAAILWNWLDEHK